MCSYLHRYIYLHTYKRTYLLLAMTDFKFKGMRLCSASLQHSKCFFFFLNIICILWLRSLDLIYQRNWINIYGYVDGYVYMDVSMYVHVSLAKVNILCSCLWEFGFINSVLFFFPIIFNQKVYTKVWRCSSLIKANWNDHVKALNANANYTRKRQRGR